MCTYIDVRSEIGFIYSIFDYSNDLIDSDRIQINKLYTFYYILLIKVYLY